MQFCVRTLRPRVQDLAGRRARANVDSKWSHCDAQRPFPPSLTQCCPLPAPVLLLLLLCLLLLRLLLLRLLLLCLLLLRLLLLLQAKGEWGGRRSVRCALLVNESGCAQVRAGGRALRAGEPVGISYGQTLLPRAVPRMRCLPACRPSC